MPSLNNTSLVKFLSKNTTATVLGSTENYAQMNNHKVAEGAFFDSTAVQGSSKVAVLGSKIKKELFGGRPAIDEKIKISGNLGVRTFTVVGVMEEKGNVAFTDVDRQVIIPISTAMDIYGAKAVNMILCEADSPADPDIEKAKEQIKRLLRSRHKIRAGQQDDFQVQAQKEFVQQFDTFRTLISIVLGSIAGISLAVGGIGIMNIMLVAVTERTREIGVRMAMGAQRGDVMQQFLVEASIVSFLGGGLGVLTGWGLATTIERMTRIFETITTMWAIGVALLMATVVGIVSGLYPAWKASRLDPVEALRYE
jgi:putative ABC transport system permease protein